MAFLDPLPRFEASQPGNVLRIFERGRRDPQEVGIPNPFEDPGKPQRRPEQPRPGDPQPHRPRLRRPPEDAALRPDAQLPGDQRPSRRLSLQRLHGLPRDLCQRPLAGQLGPLRRLRPPGPQLPGATPPSRATSRATRSSTSSPWPSPPASASSAMSILVRTCSILTPATCGGTKRPMAS